MLNKHEIGKILASQLFDLMRDNKYGYASSTPAYSHLTEDGQRVMAELIHLLAPKVVEAQREHDKQLAEKLVMDNLKS